MGSHGAFTRSHCTWPCMKAGLKLGAQSSGYLNRFFSHDFVASVYSESSAVCLIGDDFTDLVSNETCSL
jgi:hypothetical protein